VEEFFGEPLQRLRKQIEQHFGFQVLMARTEVGGYCAHCQILRKHEMEQTQGLEPASVPEGKRRSGVRRRA
jgi:Fur family ferric uptake transcriptional regulator